MSYIAERRVEEKERRRTEILDAANRLYAEKGWESVTVDQVARGARLSRALVYVYFKDKEELLFAVGERAMRLLRDRFIAASASKPLGMEKIEAIGVVVQAIEAGVRDGSIRSNIGDPMMLAVSMWAFTHGLIQLTMAKGSDLERFGIGIPALSDYGFGLLRLVAQAGQGFNSHG